MAAKTTDWRPGPTVCRCCLSEGCYKDISTEYFWMGKREVYSEMLSDTFSLSIAYSTSGGPNSNSRLICEPCISRLRDASEFKRQVQECEKTFMQYLDPGSEPLSDFDDARVEMPAGAIDTQVKVEPVKLEKDEDSEAGDFDDQPDYLDDDDDDLDDQPLTRLATKVPKKESVDLLELLDTGKTAEKRRSTTKAKAGPAKKAKTKKEVVKATSSKATKQTEKKKKESSQTDTDARLNATILLQNTTAYPFKLQDQKLACVYCFDSCHTSSLFREHMETEHDEFDVTKAVNKASGAAVKADCTGMQCRHCNKAFGSLKDIAQHLFLVHDLTELNLDHFLGLIPFIMNNDNFDCALCENRYNNIYALAKHTQSHFLNVTCNKCGNAYSSIRTLKQHMKINHGISQPQQTCKKCKLEFPFPEDLKAHLLESKACCIHKCQICGDRFYSMSKRDTHMEEVHGTKVSFPCAECGTVFEKRDALRVHFVIEHTDNHHVCSICSKKFHTKPALQRHMITHTKEKNHTCGVCGKSFHRRSTLTLHMWIHSDVKKYQCELCDMKFNQKISWVKHINTYHPELASESS